MSRKKTTEENVTPATEPGLKHVRLDMPPDLHRLLRAVAGLHGMSMVAYVRKLVEDHLREEAKQKGIKL